MDERILLEKIDVLVAQHGFPIPLNTLREWTGLSADRFVSAMRTLRAVNSVKVVNGMVTFAIKPCIYLDGMQRVERRIR